MIKNGYRFFRSIANSSLFRFAIARTYKLAFVVSCLLFSLVVQAQYYDSTAKASAEDYLQKVSKEVGATLLSKFAQTDAIYLARTLGQLDRTTVSPEIFVEHLEGATKMRNHFYPDIPDESFQEYILGLRIRSELTSHASWRKRFNAELMPLIDNEADVNKAASTVFSWVQSKVKLIGETRTYPLNLKGDLDPLTTLRGGRGSEIDVAILTVACLRSVGIASRIAYAPVIANGNGGKVWVEYRDRKEWQPWAPSVPPDINTKTWLNQQFLSGWAYILANPQKPMNITNSYVQTATLWVCPRPLAVEKCTFMLMVPCDGRLQPVTGRDIYNLELDDINLSIAGGAYIIASGDHETLGGIKSINLRSGEVGWFQMDFNSKKQEFAVAKSRPNFFDWQQPDFGAKSIRAW